LEAEKRVKRESDANSSNKQDRIVKMGDSKSDNIGQEKSSPEEGSFLR